MMQCLGPPPATRVCVLVVVIWCEAWRKIDVHRWVGVHMCAGRREAQTGSTLHSLRKSASPLFPPPEGYPAIRGVLYTWPKAARIRDSASAARTTTFIAATVPQRSSSQGAPAP